MIKKCFIDLETTGVDPRRCGIVEIGGSVEYNGKEFPFEFQLSPFNTDRIKDMIDEKALAVLGVTAQELYNRESPRDVYRKLINFFDRHVNKYDPKDKFFFIAYNGNFDNQFLRQFFLKNQDVYFGSWFFTPVIDVMTIAGFFLRNKRTELENFKLHTVAKYLKIPIEERELHSASYDARILKEIYNKLEQQF